MKFGEFVRRRRQEMKLGLREFCQQYRHDPSNWSKIERGTLAPSQSEETLANWAVQLGIEPGSDDWHTFMDLASIARGAIPNDLLTDTEAVEKLPLVFRTIRGDQPTTEELKALIEKIRSNK